MKSGSKKVSATKPSKVVVPTRGGVPVKAHLKAGRAKPPQ
jgi:hypothetical protein